MPIYARILAQQMQSIHKNQLQHCFCHSDMISATVDWSSAFENDHRKTDNGKETSTGFQDWTLQLFTHLQNIFYSCNVVMLIVPQNYKCRLFIVYPVERLVLGDTSKAGYLVLLGTSQYVYQHKGTNPTS